MLRTSRVNRPIGQLRDREPFFNQTGTGGPSGSPCKGLFGWLFFVETGDPRRQKSLGIRGHCRHRRRSSKSKWLETLPETNRCDIAPENQWLEDVFPIYVYTYYIETVPFWGTCEFSAPFIASLGV